MLSVGDKVGIVCCSNGQKREYEGKLWELLDTLRGMGIEPVLSDYIFERDGVAAGTGKERAGAVMDFYVDDQIKGIFDISGGDIANGVLPYLDYDIIGQSSKLFWGYSDLTTLVNAIYAKCGRSSVLYQIRNVVSEHGIQQVADCKNTILEGKNDLFHINYKFVQGNEMHGVVVGGNIRCFLKLAGTQYMPELSGKILLLEARRGVPAQLEASLCQLQQMGAFEKVSGVLLGTFSQLQKIKSMPSIESLVKKYVPENLPIAVTDQIGHGTDSKAIMIGKELP